ncbi:MAG: HDOD domain-containing protein [Bradymonadales bacterium]|nr:MAG: HDOD domain-containing protein [Bradymonadales bacterium]
MSTLAFESLVKKAEDLEMLPQTAQKVIELVGQESTNAEGLAQVIEKDASVTTRILKIANSAFYGLRREVTTVQHAIMILGYRSVRSLVVATSSRSLHKKFGITEQLLWDHSVGTAIISRILSANASPAVADLGFVGGLLHNVGRAVMNNECPKDYAEVMTGVYNEGKDCLELERQVFSFTYPEVGCRVIEKWGLPENIVRMIRYHRLSSLEEKEREFLKSSDELRHAVASVELAYELCRKIGIGFRSPQEVDLESLAAVSFLNLQADSLKSLEVECQQAYEAEREIFSAA